MKSTIWRRFGALLATAGLVAGLASVGPAATVFALAGDACDVNTPAWAAAVNEVGTECQLVGSVAITGNVTVPLTLHIFPGGSIDASAAGAPGINLAITGGLIMDAGASLIDTSDISGNGQAGGPLTISATGGAQLAAGSLIESENNFVNFNAGNISMTLGATSSFAGTISSRATAGTTSNNGGDITIKVTGDLTMAAGSAITSQKNADSGKSGDIKVTVSGDMLMQGTSGATPGALITAGHPGATNGTPAGSVTILVGNVDPTQTPPILLPPTGKFTMETGSQVDANGGGTAGDIVILAGRTADIDGSVLSESQLSGVGSPAGGGPITVQTGCGLTVSDTGLISSKGRDQGADLVHLESCDVTIFGTVQSTVFPNGGHAVTDNKCNTPNYPYQHAVDGVTFFAGCVEVWADTITVDHTGTHLGNVNVDGIRSDGNPNGGWIDLMAYHAITLNGAPSATGAVYLLSAVSNAAQGNQHGGLITAYAGGSITAKGLVANANQGGGNGNFAGKIDFQANGAGSPAGDVALDTDAFLNANVGGNTGFGGVINVQSYHGKVTGTVPGQMDAHGTGGSIAITDCLVGAYSGTTNPVTAPVGGNCGGGFGFPANVTTAFGLDVTIWDACRSHKSGMKFNDLNGNGVKESGEPGIGNWPITLTPPSGPAVTVTTAANGTYSFALGAAGTYTVCEGDSPVLPVASWVQTFPNALTPSPNGQGETIINTCPGTNAYGYQFTVSGAGAGCCGSSGPDLIDNDFGNWQPASKSGYKFNDLNGNHVADNLNGVGGEPGLNGWHITLWDATQTTKVAETDTANDGGGKPGYYKFGNLAPGSYVVCETPQLTWTQTYPQAGAGFVTCTHEGTIGWAITLVAGQNDTDNNFGNWKTQVTCKEDPNRALLLTRTVDTSKPLGGGGVAGNPENFHTLQAAYDVAKVSPNTKAEVIGMYSKTTENVVLDTYSALSMTITQCESAQLTAANSSAPVWWLTSTKKLLIIGPDSVGGTIGWWVQFGTHELKGIRANGASEAGVRVSSNGNAVSFNNIAGTGIGLDVLGNNNTFKSGTIGPNAGGVHIGAGKTGNTVSGATIQDNSLYGVWIEGSATRSRAPSCTATRSPTSWCRAPATRSWATGSRAQRVTASTSPAAATTSRTTRSARTRATASRSSRVPTTP